MGSTPFVCNIPLVRIAVSSRDAVETRPELESQSGMKSVGPLHGDKALGSSDESGPPESREGLRFVTMTVPEGRVETPGTPPNPYIGATVDGRYELEAVLGEGGMGVVYRCIHTIIGKRVAMKVLRADLARNDEVVERFLNEARSASSIGNPHIIDISDFGRLPDGATYFVMEYLEGHPLSDFLEPETLLDNDRIGWVLIQLSDALAAAHAAGIVHRDLKPDNIFLVKRGAQDDFVKVLDFGIAKATSTGSRLTQAGQVFGTPHYMSPEQAAGSVVDHRADIYAVGVILYELLTGKLPFDAENFMGILTQHMYKEPPPPSTRSPVAGRISPRLEAIVLRCLRKNPTDRYQSMEELGGDLRGYFGDMGRPSLSELRPSELGQARITLETVVTRTPRKRFALAVLLAGAVGGAAAWLLAQSAASNAIAPETGPSAELAAQQASPEKAARPLSGKLVAVAVTPEAAEVRRGADILGSSPLTVQVGPTPVLLHVSAPGFQPQDVIVDGSRSGVTVALIPQPIPRQGSSPDGQHVPTRSPEPTAKKPSPETSTGESTGEPNAATETSPTGRSRPKSNQTKASGTDILPYPW